MESNVSKATSSLPHRLEMLADRLAAEMAVSRSEVIAILHQREEMVRVQALMAEGYQTLSDENGWNPARALPLTDDAASHHQSL